MTPGWFASTCLAVSSADAAIRRVGELGPYRSEADSRQKIKNKRKKVDFTCICNWLRGCIRMWLEFG
jgi:hypothetical protein